MVWRFIERYLFTSGIERRLMLSHQVTCYSNRQPSQDLIVRVDMSPDPDVREICLEVNGIEEFRSEVLGSRADER
jgi:hypothetical protein